MIVTTTENVAGHRTIEALGQVFGVVVRSISTLFRSKLT